MPRKPPSQHTPDSDRSAADDGASTGTPKLPTKALRSRVPRQYEVGYAKPPAGSRFQPGQSGNPSGRPKGRRTGPAPIMERMKAIVIQEAYRTIKVVDGDRRLSVPIAQAAIRSLAVNAAKGQPWAQKHFANLLRDVEAQNRAEHHGWLQVVIDYKLSCEREIQRAKDQGLTPPDPLPHPEDIIVDFVADEVTIVGPMAEKDKPIFHMGWKMIVELDAKIAEAERRLARRRSDRSISKLTEYIQSRRVVRAKLFAYYGEPPRRFREPEEDCDSS